MRPERVVSVALAVTMVASLGLVVVYLTGGSRPWEGVLLGLALGGLGVGIVTWATRLFEDSDEVEEREPFASPDAGDDLFGGEITRRRALARLLIAAGGTLAGALAIPTLSLGPHPGDSLFFTRWSGGRRVVNDRGEPLRPEDLPVDGVVTVFPEGFVGGAEEQTQLIRVPTELLDLPDGRNEWAPEGCVAYSKICTHAGCPVGLYRASAHQLLCPCHQSTFDVLTGANPVFGPAARPLPQLPLGIDESGFLVALDDFADPVGPSFWNVTSDEERER
jgi:ubiquinol-cytochrome c reductase iron-sulfur subunit